MRFDPKFPVWKALMVSAIDASAKRSKRISGDYISGKISRDVCRQQHLAKDVALERRLHKLETSFYGER